MVWDLTFIESGKYLPEDSARHVDWKATAKNGELKVREFAREDERRLRVVFDNPVAGIIQPQAYERMVSLAASVAWRLSQQGVLLSFVSQQFEATGDAFRFPRSPGGDSTKTWNIGA